MLLFITATIVSAQKNTINQPELDTGSIASKFDYIIKESYAYKDFQMIRKSSLLKIKNQVLDSIVFFQKNLTEANQTVQQNTKTIDSLQQELNHFKQELNNLSKAEDSMSFFGATLSKLSYNLIMWITVLTLLGATILLTFLMKKNKIDTKRAIAYAKKVEDEMESFRKKTLLKEQEMMRKLQNEINKNSN